jgi:hypothetical protein
MTMNNTIGVLALSQDDNDAQIELVHEGTGIGNAAGEGFGGIFYLHRPGDGTMQPTISGHGTGLQTTTVMNYGFGGGGRKAVIVLDRIQFLFSTGNVTTGRMTVYGVAHA